MSAKEIAKKLGAPASAVERKIWKLDLPRCPRHIRDQRAGKNRRRWTKHRIISNIAELFDEGQANSAFVQQRHTALFAAAQKVFGSYRAAVEAAGIDYDRVSLYASRRTWKREDIIAEIRRMHSEGISLRASHVRDNHSPLLNAARREFKKWKTAIEAAGLDYSKIRGARWGTPYKGADGYVYGSEAEGKVGERLHLLLIQGVLADLYRQVRLTPNRRWSCDFVAELPAGGLVWIEMDGLGGGRTDGAYNEEHPKIKYYKHKGFDFAVVRTPEQAEEAVRRKARGLLRPPHDSPREIIEIGSNRYTEDEIVDDIRRVGQQLGRAPTTAEFIKWGRISPQTVSRRVGWNEALQRAGYLPHRNASKQLLLDELRRVITDIGRSPSCAEFDARSSLTALMIARRFGSWAAAVRAAGAEPTYESHVWTEKRVVTELRAADKCLQRLTHQHLAANGKRSLFYAAQRLFGSLTQALEAAGIDPRARMVGWSRRFDVCVICETTNHRHASKGRCVRCYEREQRALRRASG